jgi:K+-transporting ATPase A subunit
MRILARLAIWVLFALAFLTLLNAVILAGRGGGVLEVLLYVLIGVGFIAAALYLRSRSEG